MISILGWYNQRNIGDDAFKDAFKIAFNYSGLGAELRFCTAEAIITLPTILGGGDVIRPFYIDKLVGAPAVIPVGVGIGYESEAQLLRKLNIPLAVVRNRADCKILGEVGIFAEYCPDITFVLDKINGEAVSTDQKQLGVLLSDEINPTFERRESSDYLYYEFFKWELAAVLDELSQYYQINFIPFSTLDSIDDRRIAGDVFRRMHNRGAATLGERIDSVKEARALIAQQDLLISMKFHGIMFAVQSGVPFLSIAETRKTSLFCEENGLAEFIVPKFSFHRNRVFDLVKRAELEASRELVSHVGRTLTQEAHSVLQKVMPRIAEIYRQS